MPAEVVTEAEQMPRRARYLVPRGFPRRAEILAACVVLLVLGHVLFGQLTIIVAAVLYLITKLTRWRLSWLVLPAAAALVWTAAVGLGPAAAGFGDGPAQVLSYLGTPGHQVSHLLHFTTAFAGVASWLPRQLPLALLTGAAEAALAGGLTLVAPPPWGAPPRAPPATVAGSGAGAGGRAQLAAPRPGGAAAGPARADRGDQARRHGARHPRGRCRDQGWRMPGRGGGHWYPGRALLGRGGRRGIGVRLGRAGGTGHRLS